MNDETAVPEEPEIPEEANEAPPDPAEALRAENAELRDRLLRLAAEMENLRKRTEREIVDTRTYSIAGFARDMLTATDSLSRALVVLPPDARETAEVLAEDRVALVGHRARALLAHGERLLGLTDLGALPVPHVGREPLDLCMLDV